MRVLTMLWKEHKKRLGALLRTTAERIDPEPPKIYGVLKRDKKAGEFLTPDDWLTRGTIRVTSGASIFDEERPA